MIDAALGARARGLGARLMSAEQLAAIESAPDLASLEAALLGPRRVAVGAETAASVDHEVGRRAGDDLIVLDRWCPGNAAVAVVADELDAHDLRSIVRGLAGHVAVTRRLAGTIPTPSLPQDSLVTLAACSTLTELAEVLARRQHPYAAAIAAARTPVDLLAIEAAITRRFAARARAVRGDRALRTFVAQGLEARDASAALQLAERGAELDPDDYLVASGTRRAALVAAARGPIGAAREILVRAFARTPLAAALGGGAPRALEDAALEWQLTTQTALRRREPLGSASVLWLVLARRLEVRRTRRAAWRLALGGRS